jgi:hypothetical protein
MGSGRKATIEDLKETDIAEHAAARAWRKVGLKRGLPHSIETLRDDKSTVYRLAGVGPEGTCVIAKRCDAQAAGIEYLVYKDILPQLGISALQCYASIEDDDPKFSWLFLEDAGNEEYSPDLEEHRILAGNWLGAMNISAQRLAIAERLPDQGPASYLEILQLARSMTREKLEHPAFSDDARQILGIIADHCDFLEMHWNRIERFCATIPRTLVHGDLSVWNARIRTNQTGKRLLILDWESAGWGVPAADLAQFAGNSLTPDIAAYWSVAHAGWSRVHLSDVRRLGELGSIFRWINAIAWANWGFHEGAGEWYMSEMIWYEPNLAEWAQGTECLLDLK